jgi:hypothetical protein
MTNKQPLVDESRELLIAEFEYIAGTANQANEDRARVSSFYLVAVGSLIVALFSTQLLDAQFDMRMLNLLLAGLFFILTLLGSLTIMQLSRLRGAWFESMLAMNQIKEYIVGRDRDLANAFRWKSNTAPQLYKVNSISYQQTLEVAVLSAITFGVAVYCFESGIENVRWFVDWFWAGGGALLVFFGQLALYKRLMTGEQRKLASRDSADAKGRSGRMNSEFTAQERDSR